MDKAEKVRSLQEAARGQSYRGRNVFLAVLVLAIAIGAILLVPRAFDGDARTASAGRGPGEAAPIPLQGQPVITDTIQLEPGVTDIVTGYEAVWASTPNSVVRIDPATNEVTQTIPVEGIGDSGKLAVGEGAVWVTHAVSHVSRIDPVTNLVVATIDVGPGVRGVTTGAGSVWVTREPQPDEINGYVVRIDPSTNTVSGEPTEVGIGPGPVTFGAGSVWVTLTSYSGTLVKVDPSTMEIEDEVKGARGSAWHVAGRMWAATGSSVLEIDPDTAEVIETYPLPLSWEVDFGLDAAWVLTNAYSKSDIYTPDPSRPARVFEVDARNGRPVGKPVPVGDSPSVLAVGEGAAWVAQYDSGLITRIEPRR